MLAFCTWNSFLFFSANLVGLSVGESVVRDNSSFSLGISSFVKELNVLSIGFFKGLEVALEEAKKHPDIMLK